METAMKKLKPRKAPGPDKIKNEMLCHMGKKARLILLFAINRTWREAKIPAAWRTANITPILKKGKPVDDPLSYRPISLTSCLGKLAERMVNNRLYWWLEKTQSLDNTQAGFRRGCRTEDQLFRLVQNTIDGFQNEKHTTAVFIDLQQAYDRVWRKGLLMKMLNMGIHGKMLQWIQTFLQNRTIGTSFSGTMSSKRTLEEGLPQGSALSCTLFLIFINDLPSLLNTQKALFADDLVIWTSEKYPVLTRAKLNRTLAIISTYCNLWKLKVNEQKTVYTTFSRSPKTTQRTFRLTMNGALLKKEENPTYLGVKLDKQLRMTEHINNIKEKASKRLNMVKRLASTTWGADKSTLRQLYLGSSPSYSK
uniref:Reverse transcriptase domain-containing protein n=2 Tax=Arion vulgaris TaxID=1028688 RepID=A0A0B7BRX1_9EUPU